MRNEMKENGEEFKGEIWGREDLLQRAIWASTARLEQERLRIVDFIRLAETSGALAGGQPKKNRFGWSRTTRRQPNE